MPETWVILSDFESGEDLAVPFRYDPAIPLPSEGDVVTFRHQPEMVFVCRYRTFEYVGNNLTHLRVAMSERTDEEMA